MNQYYLKMNDSKTQIIIFGPTKVLSEIKIHGLNIGTDVTIRFQSTVKNLGVLMDSGLTFEDQVVKLKKQCFRTLRNIYKIRFLLSREQLKTVVNSLVVSCLDYCNCLFYGISERLLHQLQVIQNAAAKLVTGKYKYDHVGDDLRNLHWLNIKQRVIFKVGLLAYKAVNGLSPVYLQNMFQYNHYGHTPKLNVPAMDLSYGRRSFSFTGPRLLNNIPQYIVKSENVTIFKSRLKTYLFSKNEYEVNRLLNN